jgi:hypothetical protein
MKTVRKLYLLPAWIFAVACGSALLFFTPTPARGQTVDNCTSGTINFYNNGNVAIEESVCISGNATQLTATASATQNSGPYTIFGVDLELYDNGSFVSQTGVPGSSYESRSFVPNQGDTYTAYGVIYACLGTFSQYCFDPVGQLSVLAAPTSILYPAYKVTSIVYDTPGNKGYSGFVNGTTDGTRTSIGSNFTQGSSVTYTSGGNFLNLGGTLSVTFNESATTGNSSEVTDTFTQGTGVENTSQTNPINHGEDMFLVWLNPAVSITPTGQGSVVFSMGTQSEANGDSEPIDHVTAYAQDMQGSNGNSTILPFWLEPQYDPATHNKDLPGLAAICANLNATEYQTFTCSQTDQCGCKTTDFSGILAQDPLLNYGPTDNPLNADTSGSGTCGQLPSPPSSAQCRYLSVPDPNNNSIQATTTLQGPSCQNCNYPSNTGSFTDKYMTTQTYTESVGQSVGYSWKVKYGIGSFANGSSWEWTNSESSGSVNGYSNSMNYAIETTTVNCAETLAVFYDTVYRTYAFQDVSDNGLCQ